MGACLSLQKASQLPNCRWCYQHHWLMTQVVWQLAQQPRTITEISPFLGLMKTISALGYLISMLKKHSKTKHMFTPKRKIPRKHHAFCFFGGVSCNHFFLVLEGISWNTNTCVTPRKLLLLGLSDKDGEKGFGLLGRFRTVQACFTVCVQFNHLSFNTTIEFTN